jgi:hypothetical protein
MTVILFFLLAFCSEVVGTVAGFGSSVFSSRSQDSFSTLSPHQPPSIRASILAE